MECSEVENLSDYFRMSDQTERISLLLEMLRLWKNVNDLKIPNVVHISRRRKRNRKWKRKSRQTTLLHVKQAASEFNTHNICFWRFFLAFVLNTIVKMRRSRFCVVQTVIRFTCIASCALFAAYAKQSAKVRKKK